MNTLTKQKWDARGYSSKRQDYRKAEHCSDPQLLKEAAELAQELTMREALAAILWERKEANGYTRREADQKARTLADR